MSTTGLEVFDTTVHETNSWLKGITNELGWGDRHLAYQGLRGVLHALRDNLPVEETAHFTAQLPMLVRGIYYEGWNPTHVPLKERHREDFLRHVAAAFTRGPEVDPADMTRAVFKVIDDHVTPGETEDVRSVLPSEVRELWSRAGTRP